ncbi:hypothetical protein ACGFNV_33660 [Streptomyces sp. NPDC048751]|uniref:hypothetical protein n=1 Tax=Streptomyces sp. NPDC048751 TaxID=3365591 RepID=UPI003722222C
MTTGATGSRGTTGSTGNTGLLAGLTALVTRAGGGIGPGVVDGGVSARPTW